MTKKIKIRNYNKHNTYGGQIYMWDFDAHHYMGDIAKRIALDQSFDMLCCNNIKNRSRINKYHE